MNFQSAPDQRARVAEFQRRHRVALLTMVFTDIVGSTRLKQELGEAEAVTLMRRHHEMLRETLARFTEGEVIVVAGDSFFLVFTRPSDALRYALLVQRQVRGLATTVGHAIGDRIGIHVGEVHIVESEGTAQKDLYGLQVDTCARVMSLGDADQILLTRSAFDSARQVLRGEHAEGLGELTWLSHGIFTLKGVEDPVEVCEVGEAGVARLQVPGDSEKAHRLVSEDNQTVRGWRPAVGQLVPRTQWKLEQKMGEGGFGEVWRASLPALKAERVFKFCFRADRVRSLRREAIAFSRLKEHAGDHPNVIAVTDLCLDEPPFYLAMELAAGGDLRAWFAAQGGIEHVDLDIRLAMVAQVAVALQAAHAAGVIHGDVKPANILVSDRPLPRAEAGAPHAASLSAPLVKLSDFGIGHVLSEERARGSTATAGAFEPGSTAGSNSGTQMFMAPELTAGKPMSPQSDIYALGVVLLQLVACDFTRPVTVDWSAAVEDRRLKHLLQRCFAGNPDERFENAADLASGLRALLPPPGKDAPGAKRAVGAGHSQPPGFRPSRLAVAAILSLVILAAAFVLWRLTGPGAFRTRSGPKRHLAVVPFTTAENDPNLEAISQGMAETLAGRLAEAQPGPRDLLVIPMSEVRGEKIVSARQARELFGATVALTGSLQRQGEQIRLNLTLVDCQGLRALQSTNVEIAPNQIYSKEDEVGRMAAAWLGLPPPALALSSSPNGHIPSADAYIPYLQGMGLLARYDRGENLDQALVAFQNALAKDTNFALAKAALGRTEWHKYERTHDPVWLDKSVEICRSALASSPGMAQAYVTLGLVESSTGKAGQAVEHFQKALELDPMDGAALRGLARAYEKLGQTSRAEATLKEAIAHDPDYWAGHNNLGVLYANLGQYPAAEQCFLRVTQLTPDNYQGYRNLGGLYSLMGRTSEAKAMSAKSLSLRPTPEALSNLGTIAFFEGRYTDAAKSYENAVALTDSRPVYWGNLGDAYRLCATNDLPAAKAYKKALSLAEDALARDPLDAETRAELAVYCLNLGDTNRAAAEIDQALRLGESDVNVLFLAALVRVRSGQPSRAIEHLEIAARGGYSSAEILQHPDFADLRKEPAFAKVARYFQNANAKSNR